MGSYRKEFTIQATPDQVYSAITTEEGLAAWWTPRVELYPHIGGTATFHFGKDEYVVMKIAKLVSNKDITWKCVEQHFITQGTDKTDEWVGTTIKFSLLSNPDGSTHILFIHDGLIPELYCYKECESGWNHFLTSLKKYVETGNGTPYNSTKD